MINDITGREIQNGCWLAAGYRVGNSGSLKLCYVESIDRDKPLVTSFTNSFGEWKKSCKNGRLICTDRTIIIDPVSVPLDVLKLWRNSK